MKLIGLAALVLGLAACSSPSEKTAPMGKPDKQAMAGSQVRAQKVSAGISSTALATAIETALKKLPGGEALAAKIEIENNKPLIEVKVFSQGKLYEVEIDATTGAVLEVEQDDDDDDDEEDDEDGDDD